MNWLTQNKLLSAFLILSALVALALGYLLMGANEGYETAQGEYASKLSELQRLQGLKPFPEEASFKKLDAQKKQQAAVIQDLAEKLHAASLPMEAMSPEQFQDKLRESAIRIHAKAAQKNVKLPEKFFLGFDKYKDSPPPKEAAPLLGRQLLGLELVLDQMIDDGIISLSKLERTPFPEEDPKTRKPGPAEAAGPQAANAPKAGKDTAKKAPFTKSAFVVEFASDQNRFRSVLNGLASSPKQFFIAREVKVKNDHDAAPLRAEGGPAVGPETGDAKGAALKLIFGNEKVAVTLQLEMLSFAEPAK